MFGYIKPQKSELLVRELEEYGGVYCALCRRLGRDYGPAARLVLNYDCTFYALVLFAVSENGNPRFHRGRCVVNPLKRCSFCAESGGELASASALTVILAYYKAKDNIADCGFWKGLFFRLTYPLFSFMHRRAARKFPALEEAAADAMQEQARVEQTENPDIDRCAEPTARMLARIFGQSCGKGEMPRVLHEMGYCLGRWTYLMDAADDVAKDIKRNAFNPFVIRFRLDRNSTQESLDRARDYANETLNGTLAKLGAAVNLLKLGSFERTIRNVIFLGLPMMQKERLYKKENGNVRSV